MKLLLAAALATTIAQDLASPSNGTVAGPSQPHRALLIGGKAAPKGAYPWVAQLKENVLGRFTCAGVLIAPQYVLTSANCAVTGQKYVSLGDVLIVSGGGGVGTEVISVVGSISPQGSTSVSLSPIQGNNIGIVKLTTPSKLPPIPLSRVDPGVAVKTFGWGYTSYPQSALSNALNELNMTTVANADCQSRLRQSPNFKDWVAKPLHLCAGGVAGQGMCTGDSGGPLVKATPTGFAVVGIASFGEPCAKGFPDVFERVSEYAAFINSNVQGHKWV